MPVRTPFLFGIHDHAELLHRQGRLLVLMDQAHEPDQRRGDATGKHLEGDQGTDRQCSIKHLARSDPYQYHDH